jgi:hypothetical protein
MAGMGSINTTRVPTIASILIGLHIQYEVRPGKMIVTEKENRKDAKEAQRTQRNQSGFFAYSATTWRLCG